MKKIATVLGVIMLFTCCLSGCGTPEIEDSETNLIIELYEGGYGLESYKKIARKFEEVYAEEGYTVTILPNPVLVANGVETKLQAGPKLNSTDLYLAGDVNFRNIISRGSSYIRGYDYALEDLTDLYNSKVYGEETLYKNKLNAEYANYNEIDGRYYTTNWAGGPSGFVYNADFFKENEWELPRTTDEMVEEIEKMKNDGYTPFVWCGSSVAYWEYAVIPWWRQFATDSEVESFWSCTDEYGDQSAEVFKSYSRLQAYNQLESMISNPANSHGKSMIYSNIEAQMMLYNSSNKVVMMPTGDWVENEMGNNGYAPDSVNVGFMRVPVTSEVLYEYDSIGNKSNRFNTVKTEAILREVITAVDNGDTEYPGVTDEDFLAIKKIRSYTYTCGYIHNAFIPAYANAKEVAKKFLLYMASDEALQIYYNENKNYMPFDNSNVQAGAQATTFQKDLEKLIKNVSYVSTGDSKHKIFYKTDLTFNRGFLEAHIGTTDATDKKTGREYWDYVYQYVKTNFEVYQGHAK